MRLNSRNDLMHGARHIPLVHHRLGHKNIPSNFVLDIDSNAYTIYRTALHNVHRPIIYT